MRSFQEGGMGPEFLVVVQEVSLASQYLMLWFCTVAAPHCSEFTSLVEVLSLNLYNGIILSILTHFARTSFRIAFMLVLAKIVPPTAACTAIWNVVIIKE